MNAAFPTLGRRSPGARIFERLAQYVKHFFQARVSHELAILVILFSSLKSSPAFYPQCG
jgi:hypothetical protein